MEPTQNHSIIAVHYEGDARPGGGEAAIRRIDLYDDLSADEADALHPRLLDAVLADLAAEGIVPEDVSKALDGGEGPARIVVAYSRRRRPGTWIAFRASRDTPLGYLLRR